ncbi:MAG TPA: SLC13 family permease [Candidatus Polarisedimenticolaceae bacterium]|nr:SLC13 family permease [Candidatus Polarisedimenticolaceae bacterium]
MGWEGWFTLGLVGLMGVALVRGMAGPDTTLLAGITVLMTMRLFSTRFPRPVELVAGFGNEGLVTIAVLFVVASGLSRTGAMDMLTRPLLGRPRSVPRAQLRVMAPVAALSAFINNTPIVAVFTPVIADWCRATRLQPGKLFIPLSYAAVLGGTCSLIGTSTNVYVYGWLDAELKQRVGMFTIGCVGLPAAVIGIAYVLLVSRRLLPSGTTLDRQIGDVREYTVEMLVEPNSAIDGKTIEQAGLRHLPGVYLIEIERGDEMLAAVGPRQTLFGGDRLIFVGVVESVRDLQRIRGLVPATDQVFKLTGAHGNRVLVEAVVGSQFPALGRTVREGEFRTRYDAAIIAVHRGGERIRKKIGEIVLRPGDTLLLETHPEFVKRYRDSNHFHLTSTLPDSTPRRHDRAWVAVGILAAMILAVTIGVLGLLNAALIATGLMVVTRCTTPAEALEQVNWRVLLAMGAAIGVGVSLESTGAASSIARLAIEGTRGLHPTTLLAAIYLLTLLFNVLVGHAAAAALAFPVAQAAAVSTGVDFLPFVIVVMMAASADFANPVSYPTHLMVYGAGGYRFGDFVRIGLPLNVLVMIVTVGLAPWIWPLHH